ncbi:hypothetical protein MYX78_09505 [Acidobacteria bacterium AH-259-G07]|nr:hypothetical protein [Acidobacteria bacterium AH-259-G07]
MSFLRLDELFSTAALALLQCLSLPPGRPRVTDGKTPTRRAHFPQVAIISLPHYFTTSGLGKRPEHGQYRSRCCSGQTRYVSCAQSFAIPRFLCRRQGPDRSEHVTFSILPHSLVARRRFSVRLMIWGLKLLLLGRQSAAQVLEALMALSPEGEEAFALEEVSVYRILDLFSGVYVRLQSFPSNGASELFRWCRLTVLNAKPFEFQWQCEEA